jgi:hypothetical protein
MSELQDGLKVSEHLYDQSVVTEPQEPKKNLKTNDVIQKMHIPILPKFSLTSPKKRSHGLQGQRFKLELRQCTILTAAVQDVQLLGPNSPERKKDIQTAEKVASKSPTKPHPQF